MHILYTVSITYYNKEVESKEALEMRPLTERKKERERAAVALALQRFLSLSACVHQNNNNKNGQFLFTINEGKDSHVWEHSDSSSSRFVVFGTRYVLLESFHDQIDKLPLNIRCNYDQMDDIKYVVCNKNI